MNDTRHVGPWGLALGYFAFYIPYCLLTKALSEGTLPGATGPVSGFELLPATCIATTVTLLVILTATGGWKSLQGVRIKGRLIRAPRPATFFSGIATCVIIATTTLNYTFTGISILFALLLMRGGVLIMAPLIDLAFGRKVHRHSWGALVLSLTAIGIAFSEVGGYRLSLLAGLNLAAYLLGYLLRLQFMTRTAKSPRHAENTRFFVEETLVAVIALTLLPALVALFLPGAIPDQMRRGFTAMLTGPMLVPALAIGVAYGCLYVFGSRIYLQPRENTYCIPLNRCASLLSGVAASFAMTLLFAQPAPSPIQLTGAGVIITALLLLAIPRTRGLPAVAQIYLFICNRNTSRSPIAAALCRNEIAEMLGIRPEALERAGIRVVSAGLNATSGAPLKDVARQALRELDAPSDGHASQTVTEQMVSAASAVVCMTDEQRRALVEQHPSAASKTHRLDPETDIHEPVEGTVQQYVELGRHIQTRLREWCDRHMELELARA